MLSLMIVSNKEDFIMLFLAVLLTVVLFLLHVLGVIAISWWLVFSPLLVVVAMAIVGTIITFSLFFLGLFHHKR